MWLTINKDKKIADCDDYPEKLSDGMIHIRPPYVYAPAPVLLPEPPSPAWWRQVTGLSPRSSEWPESRLRLRLTGDSVRCITIQHLLPGRLGSSSPKSQTYFHPLSIILSSILFPLTLLLWVRINISLSKFLHSYSWTLCICICAWQHNGLSPGQSGSGCIEESDQLCCCHPLLYIDVLLPLFPFMFHYDVCIFVSWVETNIELIL